MNIVLLKLILLVGMFLLTAIAGLAPLRVLKILRARAARASTSTGHRHVSLILCLLTCFSGGVFLATCFLHLLPELLELVDHMKTTYHWSIDYPIAELLSCIGFFLLFAMEELVIWALPQYAHGHSHGGALSDEGHSHRANGDEVVNEGSPLTIAASLPPPASTAAERNGGNAAAAAVGKAGNSDCCMATTAHFSNSSSENKERKRVRLSVKSVGEPQQADGHCTTHCPLTVHSRPLVKSDIECGAASSSDAFTSLALAEPERCETNCAGRKEDPPILMVSAPHAHSHQVRSITFVLAISLHSVIEGVALGVQNNATEVTTLWLSLMVHKLIVAFSVGLQLARTHAHALRMVVLSIAIFSAMSPLGALVGMVVQDSSVLGTSQTKDIVVMICQGLAVGTFIYVTFFEVLLHERDNEHPNSVKLLVIIIGFTLIGALRLVAHHGHEEGDEHATTVSATGGASGNSTIGGHSH